MRPQCLPWRFRPGLSCSSLPEKTGRLREKERSHLEKQSLNRGDDLKAPSLSHLTCCPENSANNTVSRDLALWTMRFWRDRVTFVRLMDGLGTYSEGTSTQTWKNVCPPGPHYLALLIYVSQPLPHMKIINSKYCSTMMDHHVESCFKLATSRYCPDSAQPADSDQCKS